MAAIDFEPEVVVVSRSPCEDSQGPFAVSVFQAGGVIVGVIAAGFLSSFPLAGAAGHRVVPRYSDDIE